MSKSKKLSGQPCVMVPAELFLEMAREHSRVPVENRRYFAELPALESLAYRKVKALGPKQ